MSAIISKESLMQKVAAHRKTLLAKQAADAGGPTDPTNTGTAAIPQDPNGNGSQATGVPAGAANVADAPPADSRVLAETAPAGSGSGHVPATQDGAAIDARTNETLAKSAKFIAALKGNLVKIQEQVKGAAQAPAQPTTAQPAAAAQPVDAGVKVAAADALTDEAVKAANERFRHIGALVCGDEAGRAFVEDLLTKQAGNSAAQVWLKEAADSALVYERLGALHLQEQQAKQAADAEYNAMLDRMTPAQRNETIKLASMYAQESQLFASADDDFWFQKGAAAAQDMMAQAGPEGMDPAAQPMPGGDGVPTPEDAIQLLQQLIQQGIITEEEAQQVLEQMAAEMGGAPGGDPAAGGVPPEAMDPAAAAGGIPPSEEQKVASEALKALGAIDLEAITA